MNHGAGSVQRLWRASVSQPSAKLYYTISNQLANGHRDVVCHTLTPSHPAVINPFNGTIDHATVSPLPRAVSKPQISSMFTVATTVWRVCPGLCPVSLAGQLLGMRESPRAGRSAC